MSQTKRTRRVIRPGEGPPQADIQQGQFDLQPRHSSGVVVRVRFGVSLSSTSHKNPSAMDSQPPKSQPAHPTRQWVQKFILLALFLQKKSGNGMGPFGLDQLPQTLEFWKNTRIFFFNSILIGIILWEYFSWRRELCEEKLWEVVDIHQTKIWALAFPLPQNSPRKTKLDFPLPGYPMDCVVSLRSSWENSFLAIPPKYPFYCPNYTNFTSLIPVFLRISFNKSKGFL